MERTYQEVVDTISNARRFGRQPGVEVTAHMLSVLAQRGMDGYRRIPFIHVAGTNGKGSVCAFLNSILTEAGLRVGVFTSPHLIAFEERIVANGQRIAEADVQRLGNLLLGMEFDLCPTMFDYCLVMALLYFAEQSCDVMILETGLGGRLDSTNAVGTPAVSVITKIGLDHMAVLGDSLTQIAQEKAGIIKEGTALVLETQEAEVLSVFLEEAKRHKLCHVHVVSREEIEKMRAAKLPLQGTYQWENAAAAAAAARMFLQQQYGENLQEQVLSAGIAKTVWPGRMEQLSDHPFLLVDGAHNGHGVHALYESLTNLYPGEKFHFVMAVMADKDYENMIEELLPLAIDFATYTPESERALQGKQLAECIRSRGVAVTEVESVREIFARLKEGEKTICFGSLYFIGEVCAYHAAESGMNR